MRSSTRCVHFRHSFSLNGIVGHQPAGSYVVQTHRPVFRPGLARPARATTLIEIPAVRDSVHVTVAAVVDAGDLESALILDAARRTRPRCV